VAKPLRDPFLRQFVQNRAPAGLIEPGNINLHNRIPAMYGGDIASVRSITITTPHGAVLIPTAINGHVVSNEVSIRHYQLTGEHLGVFRNEKAADTYAEQLHRAQAREYANVVHQTAQVAERRKHA
jgi:hypothetical protein